MSLTKEEWKSQLGYVRTAIEVALSLLVNSGSESAAELPADEAEAKALVQNAAQRAGLRWSIEQLSFQENGEAAEPAEISLTEEQLASLTEAVLSGELQPGSLSETQAAQLMAINRELDEITNMFDEQDPEALLAVYEDLYGKLEEQNGVLKMAYHKLVNNNLLQNIQSYIICVQYLASAKRGFGMYVSEDGIHFEQITDDGFGDPYNHGLRVFATTDEYMFIGTANPFMGTQIWRTSQPAETKTAETVPSPAGPLDKLTSFLKDLFAR